MLTGDRGQGRPDAHTSSAAVTGPISPGGVGRIQHVDQAGTAGAAADPASRDQLGHLVGVTQSCTAELIAEIRETHRRRQDFHRAEKSLTLQIKAIERRLLAASVTVTPTTELRPAASSYEDGDEVLRHADTQITRDDVALFATLPLAEARAVIKAHRLEVERECRKLAKRLPVYASFFEPVNGLGALGLAQIVGEAGDLSNYANTAKLWKRMGLAVINGKSQRRVAGGAAIEQGYSPVRRSIMFCIGESLWKKQNAYRALYLARKRYETEKALAAGLQVVPANKIPKGRAAQFSSLGHIHLRAQRYMEKRLLLNLWRAWRDQ